MVNHQEAVAVCSPVAYCQHRSQLLSIILFRQVQKYFISVQLIFEIKIVGDGYLCTQQSIQPWQTISLFPFQTGILSSCTLCRTK